MYMQIKLWEEIILMYLVVSVLIQNCMYMYLLSTMSVNI